MYSKRPEYTGKCQTCIILIPFPVMLSVGVQCNLLKPFLHSSPCTSESAHESDDFKVSDTSYEPDEESNLQDDLDDLMIKV